MTVPKLIKFLILFYSFIINLTLKKQHLVIRASFLMVCEITVLYADK